MWSSISRASSSRDIPKTASLYFSVDGMMSASLTIGRYLCRYIVVNILHTPPCASEISTARLRSLSVSLLSFHVFNSNTYYRQIYFIISAKNVSFLCYFTSLLDIHNLIPFRRARDRLAVVLREFQQSLSPEHEEQLKSIAATHEHTPNVTDVLQLTDEVNKKTSARKSRILADRVQEFLNSVQQFCNMVDACTGPNQTAALVWSCIKLAILVNRMDHNSSHYSVTLNT
jgi:hypothetical protein